jgi:group I intron endonuclease
MPYIVYKHLCTITGKSYIGQTNNLHRRTCEHKRPSSGCPIFGRAVQKHGWNNFTTEILASDLTLHQANLLEEHFISLHNTLSPSGYNLTTGGYNKSPSAETRLKTSKSGKGKKKPHSLLWRLNQSINRSGTNHPMYGKHHTDDSKLLISKFNMGKKHTPEEIEKMRKPKSKLTCPHCGLIGGSNPIKRYHLSNCKVLKAQNFPK